MSSFIHRMIWFILESPNAPKKGSKIGWTHKDHSYILTLKSFTSAKDAQDECETSHGYLVRFDTKEELTIVETKTEGLTGRDDVTGVFKTYNLYEQKILLILFHTLFVRQRLKADRIYLQTCLIQCGSVVTVHQTASGRFTEQTLKSHCQQKMDWKLSHLGCA